MQIAKHLRDGTGRQSTEMEKVGEGTHDRFIIDRESRVPRLQQKVDAWKAKT